MGQLTYKSMIYAGGVQALCVESYESIFDRVRALEMKQGDDPMTMTWLAPLELTIKAEYGPARCLVAASAISLVIEIPEARQEAVEGV